MKRKSTGLAQFVDDHGLAKTIGIWGVSRQAIEKAINDSRDIQVIEFDDHVEVVETKILQRVRLIK